LYNDGLSEETFLPFTNIPSSPITCRNLVGGDWVAPSDVEWFGVTSPYTGAVIGQVPMSGPQQIRAAVAAAEPAAVAWREVPLRERVQCLYRFRERVLSDLDPLAQLAAAEAGKTPAEALAGLLKGIEVVEFALSLPNVELGGILEVSRGVSCESRREPVGVCAGITPFNFPAMVPMWMFPIAIALGNAFVLKPSEKVPLTSCALADHLIAAGVPAGVFSIVHGGRQAVDALLDHPGVGAIGFVGSTAVARHVYARAASQGKRCLALGGAKNHLIMVPDADPAVTVDGVVAAFTGCAGQRCMAASLMVAVGEVDALIDAIVARAASIELGRDMGAIIDGGALERLCGAIEIAERAGAVLRLDGRRTPPPLGGERGHWLAPTIIDCADPESETATRELFGPILTIVRVPDLDRALELQSSNPYGNATSVFTSSGAVARRVAECAQSGMVGVNVGVPVPREPFSFGGTKASRFGQGDITGLGGVELWSYLKKITVKWSQASDRNWMS
jgi:malonate-semialdehyde dehydrogenase (acetylating)/methylmalonate-semialdehyde dehydrogenase